MSLLSGTGAKVSAAPSAWAGKVRALACVPAWWETSSICAVCEVSVQGLVTLIVHVGKSKAGRLFAAAPASRSGEEWVKHWDIADAQLREAVEACAINAYQAMAGATMADDDRPF